MKQSHSDITAVVLAGGLGTRLRSVVTDRPKVMALVNGRPFLEYLLDQLLVCGIRRVVVCTGYKADIITSYFGHSYRTLQLIYSHENEPLGTGGALRLAASSLRDNATLILNGDSYCRCDYNQFATFHNSKHALISIGIVTVPDVARYGAVELGPSEEITIFSEKGTHRGPGLINAGIYLIQRNVIDSIPPNTCFSLEKELFPRYLEKSMYGYTSCRDFIDIGIPSDYDAAQRFFSDCVFEQST